MTGRAGPWLLLVGLLLIATVAIALELTRKMERNDLVALEDDMILTARAVANRVPISPMTQDQAQELEKLLLTTQNATGSRIRVLSADRFVVGDSLKVAPERQLHLRFRPEIESAFAGQYGAYTRLADENNRSLALFVALPVFDGKKVAGAVYVSHTTDEILQRLGLVRKKVNLALVALTFLVFLSALYITGNLTRTIRTLRNLSARVAEDQTHEVRVEGDGDVAMIGQSFNRLVASLREKITELEDERVKTRLFLEDVAHELKTPVTGLCGSVEALGADELEPEVRQRLLENVERETARLSELTSRLLELQKLDYYRLRWETFDLVSVVETVVDNYESSARKRGVVIRSEGPGELSARGDAAKIQRVLENLTDNAVRCSPEGSVVRIELEPQGARVFIRVEDEGPGVTDPLLFERHRQGDPDTAPLGSLGLGLSIASEILRKHGQELGVQPREPRGARFHFSLEQVTPN